ncbi:aldehyde dehydrogenase family protein [Pseudonocardia sp. H11422]|uniref:aldehyde dehydrogenase family protein n=1 Tax=Pseudonocardia sp. H11422 TaxID=2835866 RepID=UPI001BDCABE6|nr:aldehyde dehydrogenase family protein [Pseudonocardia sp. H11422]
MARPDFSRLYIDGEFVPPVGDTQIESIDPATGRVWAAVAAAGEPDVERAATAAHTAFTTGPWPGMTGTERGRLLTELARLIDDDADELARIDSTDNGKPLGHARADAAGAAAWLRYFAGAADKIQGDYIHLSESDWAYTVPQPLGAVAAIIPWNSPVLTAAWKLGPALAAGNTVVLKPSELAPASCLRLAELVDKAGFPPGVINVVPGYGSTAGAALVAHERVAKISFTGSERTAQGIGAVAAHTSKRITTECGGKAPFIVFADADLSAAVDKAVGGGFVNAGQQCTVASRVLVQDECFSEFVDRYVRRAGTLRVGDPADPATEVGAIVSARQQERIEHYIGVARREGAEFRLGGDRHQPGDPRLAGGYFMQPTVLTGVDPASSVCQDEIFGPVVTIAPFSDEDHAVTLANDVRYGLVSGVWTRDIGRAHRVASRLDAGVVWINTYRRLHPAIPYGGFKMSGNGRENGLDALLAYTEQKSVIVDTTPSG